MHPSMLGFAAHLPIVVQDCNISRHIVTRTCIALNAANSQHAEG